MSLDTILSLMVSMWKVFDRFEKSCVNHAEAVFIVNGLIKRTHDDKTW